MNELDFDWVAPDIAIGGRFPMSEAGRLASEHGLGAVVDLREEACDEAAILARSGLAFLHLPTPDRQAVTETMLVRGVAFVAGQAAHGRRTLIHCEHGIGRSATLALCVLASRGEDPLAALVHAKNAREKVSPSPEQFEAWCGYLRRHAPAATIPDFHSFGCIAYRHLARTG